VNFECEIGNQADKTVSLARQTKKAGHNPDLFPSLSPYAASTSVVSQGE
jgi:hypothetical protein